MQQFGLILTKVLTALTALGCGVITVWSLIAGAPFILPSVSFLLFLVMGFFTYVDVKNLLKQ